jgi:hypothetical protein
MEQKEEKLNLKERYVQLRKGVGVKKEEEGGNGEEEEWRRSTSSRAEGEDAPVA